MFSDSDMTLLTVLTNCVILSGTASSTEISEAITKQSPFLASIRFLYFSNV